MRKLGMYVILLSLLLALASSCTLIGIGVVKNHPPKVPEIVSPANGATNVSLSPTLSWKAEDPDGDELTYDIYFGESNPPPLVAEGLAESSYTALGLKPETTYYWKVVAKDKYGIKAEGPVWSFKVEKSYEIKWRFELTGEDYIVSSPAIDDDGTIYIGSYDDYLYGINPDGSLKWKIAVGDFVESSPAIDKNGTIYIGDRAVNPDGTYKWEITVDGEIRSSIVIAHNDTIYLASRYYLYAIETDSGGLADTPWPMFHHDPHHTGRYGYDGWK